MQQKDFLPTLASYLIAVAEANAGKAPSERELAEHFTVSRGQVRESLAILEAMQVIERRAKSGIYLRKDQRGIEQLAFFARAGLPVDPRQIYEAVEVRKIHEIKAAELAAERATEENFVTLEGILAASEKRIAAGEGLSQLDHDFHLEIVRATQNEVFYNLCTTFYVLSEKRLSIYFKEGDRNVRSHQEHQQIYDALRRRDGALSMALMNSHLRGAMSYWSELLEDKDAKPLQ
ncbi:GntR family transcriptional regulator [Sulfitobacter sp. SK012]|uniref:FadR/GntR family transcriptional regulator n=1 Tax=Sulfitobacter sp. SK012 TaxID=1389005 RepID=UPI000E0AE62F|nr:FadR/GntR family transcriptional regulator [Sulfitobacter sp. SK012]AXI45645.1 GntR family transcriptional regulator [Sulfitobacter sp. SK012]